MKAGEVVNTKPYLISFTHNSSKTKCIALKLAIRVCSDPTIFQFCIVTIEAHVKYWITDAMKNKAHVNASNLLWLEPIPGIVFGYTMTCNVT